MSDVRGSLFVFVLIGIALGLAVIVAVRISSGQEEWTDEEEEQLAVLEASPEDLVLREDDLPAGLRDLEPAPPSVRTVDWTVGSRSGDIKDVYRWPAGDLEPLGYRATRVAYFEDPHNGGYVLSLTALPDTPSRLHDSERVNRSLDRRDDDTLEKVAAAEAEASGLSVLDYVWLKAPELGDTRYGWAIVMEDEGEAIEWCEVAFTRGPADVLIGASFEGVGCQEDILFLAALLDDRIEALLAQN